MAVAEQKLTKEIIESWLDDEFLEPFKKTQPKWGFNGLGFIVYLRTYARKKPDGSLEEWWETVRRVTLGNYLTKINGEYDHTITKEEVQQFYYLVYNLVITPPGRGLWMSGTEYAETSGDALNNCWGTAMRPHPYKKGEEPKPSFSAVFTFDQAMKGGGVGVNVQRKYTEQMPEVKNEVSVTFVCREDHPDKEKMETLGVDFYPEHEIEEGYKHALHYFQVPDSREGWAESLAHVIDAHFDGRTKLVIDISKIREEGQPIKRFGGTASGPYPLVDMLQKVNNILNNGVGRKLRPTEWGDIIQLIGTCVVAGNVRRTALILIGDEDDKEFVQSKNYSLPENAGAVAWRWASNNSVDITPDTDKETLRDLAVNIVYNGEPGYVNTELARNFGRIVDGFQKDIDGNVAVFNPCFRGDMKLLTVDGYKTFEELDGKEVKIINKDGQISTGRIWCSGEKPTVEVRFYNRDSIFVTEDHVFMLVDGEECQAKDLAGKKPMPFLKNVGGYNRTFVQYGFIQGDGQLTRLNSKDHDGLEVNIGEKDRDVLYNLFGKTEKDLLKDGRHLYITGLNEDLIRLGFSAEPLPNRTFPTTYHDWTWEQKRSFLRGMYSANGSVINARGRSRISYKTTCKDLADTLVQTLEKDFGIKAYITTNKPKKVAFSNGEYMVKESYDVNISRYMDQVAFFNWIGFEQTYKEEKLKTLLLENAPIVSSVKPTGKVEKVYDFSEPLTHWGVVEGVIAHNCGEITLEPEEPCNLFEVNLYRIEKMIKNGEATEKLYDNAFELATRYAYRVTFRPYEWERSREVISRNRRIGVGITGITDWILERYDKPAVLEFTEDGDPIYNEDVIRDLDRFYKLVKKTNREHAKALGTEPSIKLTTVKPSGTMSILMGVSPGMHYHWSKYMIRRVRLSAKSELVNALLDSGYKVEPEIKGFDENGQPIYGYNTVVAEFPIKAPTADKKYFKGARDVSLQEQVALQALLAMYWADNSVSATLSFDPIKEPVYFPDGTPVMEKNEFTGQMVPKKEINPKRAEERVEEITDILDKYKGIIKSTTMLPHDTDVYPQMPLEEIDEETYNKMVAKIKANPWEKLTGKVYEDFELDESMECVGGNCPIR